MPRPSLARRARRLPWQAVLTLALQIAREGRKRWNLDQFLKDKTFENLAAR